MRLEKAMNLRFIWLILLSGFCVACNRSETIPIMPPYGPVDISVYERILTNTSDYQDFLFNSTTRDQIGLALALIKKEHSNTPLDQLRLINSSYRLRTPGIKPSNRSHTVIVTFFQPDSIQLIENSEHLKKWTYTHYQAYFPSFDDPSNVAKPYYSKKGISTYTKHTK
ncbi:MAG: hypothetical protein AAF558_06415 [Verrucomicrobiota bacterium]